MLKIVGMGIGNPESITLGALTAMESAQKVFLQTDRVPAADFLRKYGIKFDTIDDLFNEAEDFDELCDMAAERIDGGVFCVLGGVASNLIAQAVMKRHGECEIIPGVSFAQAALDECGIAAEGAQMISAADIENAHIETDRPVVVTEVDSPYIAADVVLKLSRYTDKEIFVVMAGQARKMPIEDVNWIEENEWSYDSAIVMPALPLKEKAGYTLRDLVEVMSILRGFRGCPWDKKQTHKSLRQYLLEESYEAIDAIDEGDDFALADELGDVLFQIAFHARIGEEQSSFDDLDVTTAACKKMISRHTHIFGGDSIDTAQGVAENWEKIKRAEKGQVSLEQSMNDATLLSPIVRAGKMQKKAALAGKGINDAKQAADKLISDMGEFCARAISGQDCEQAGGDVIFDAVNVMRINGASAECALHDACRRFVRQICEENGQKNG